MKNWFKSVYLFICDQALKINSDDYYAWKSRGITLEKLGRYEEAIASYDQALKIKPDDYEVWNDRGNALSNLGRNEEAIASFDKALAIQPDFTREKIDQ
ncbi:MAG: tetratricopeptide repeat protein [Nostoc sp.]|uniref:tetratricopeptide repeat protein n=1 Tax=Nostoc sp. TaxID=1180 RepID=UPI002FF6E344